MLPVPLGLKVLLAILVLYANDIGVSYNGIGRHSSELQACFYGAASKVSSTLHVGVMARLIGQGTSPSRFTDETSLQNIGLMGGMMEGLSGASQQWLYVALTQGE